MKRWFDYFSTVFTSLSLFFQHPLQQLYQTFLFSWVIQNFSYLTSQKDFVLRIAPIHKKYKHLSIRSYPPPGYGFPPGKKQKSQEEPVNSYGLFLYPARIAKSFLYLCVFIYASTFFPILFEVFNLSHLEPSNYFIVLSCILILTIVSYYLTMYLLFRKMSPLFTDAWRLWPESQYNLFLTVPHVVSIAYRDRPLKEHKYWHPDKQTAMSHQSSEYLQGMHTVQEVLLNLGIFELFFYKNEETSTEDNGKHRSIKLENWFTYYFWPVWVSYFILIGVIAIYQMCDFKMGDISFFNFPANIIFAAFIWLIWSIRFVWNRIEYLRLLHKDVKEGVYESHLELVPQRILNSITKIPHEQQIISGINYLQNILHLVQIAAFTNIMIILEVLSNIQKNSAG